jgi:acylphosphatase
VTTAISAAEIAVQGRVQGVGYRDYTQRHAARLGLAGYVMNARDGRVIVHVEGERAVIDDLVRMLQSGPRMARVENVTVRWLDAAEGLSGFDIRYADSAR